MDLNTDDMTNIDIIKQLEQENNTPAGMIVGITTLRQQNKQPNKKPQLHHSVVIFFNKHHEANKAITNGYCINYIIHAAERFTPQFQIQQCYNCCDYGHQATHCKRHPRCGKCGEKHNTRECKHIGKAHCVHCGGEHEAWHPQCHARNAEKERLEEAMKRATVLYE